MAKFDFHKFMAVINLLGPGVLLLVPGGAAIAPLVPIIIHAIGTAEQRGGTGAEKKARVIDIVNAGVTVTNSVQGGIHLDPTEVSAATSEGIDAVIKVVHVMEGAKVVKVTAPAAGTAAGTKPPAA